MTHPRRSGTTGASGAMTLDRAAPSAVAAAPMLTAIIPVGSKSDAVAVSPLTGDVYVTNINDGTVSVISGRTNTVIATIPVDTSPDVVAVSPLTGAVYAANVGDGTVSVISG
jgi:YVTN family beta-propeller protein